MRDDLYITRLLVHDGRLFGAPAGHPDTQRPATPFPDRCIGDSFLTCDSSVSHIAAICAADLPTFDASKIVVR